MVWELRTDSARKALPQDLALLRPGPRHGASSSGSLLSGGLLAGASTTAGGGGDERMDGVVFMVTSTSDNTKIGVKSVPRSIEDFEARERARFSRICL